MKIRPPQHRRGFVLLWTLALLALVAVVLTDLTRRSAGRATQAVFAQEELQRKWAITSARQLLLPRAANLFEALEKKDPEGFKPAAAPVATLVLQQKLGDWQLDLAVSDEQAKINLNSLYPTVTAQRLSQSVRKLIGDGREELVVALRPDDRHLAKGPASRPAGNPLLNGPSNSRPELRAFCSFAQVYADETPAALFGTPRRPSPAMRDLTCWGNGQFNFTRASPAAMKTLLEFILTRSQVDRILEARRNSPEDNISHWAAAGQLNQDQKTAIENWAAKDSTCYSVRIHASNDSRNAYELAVLDQSGGVLPVAATQPSATQPATTEPTSRPQSTEEPCVYRLIW